VVTMLTREATHPLEEHGRRGVTPTPVLRLVRPRRWWKSKKWLREFLEVVLALVVLSFTSRPFVLAFRVEGTSMRPTLQDGQLLLVERASYWSADGPRRSDLVVFRDSSTTEPGLSDRTLVKRLIGIPGDRIRIDAGTVLVNDQALEEPYRGEPDISSYPSDDGALVVPDGQFFVLGDNRLHSSDSRQGWLVQRDELVGRVWLSFWPPVTWGLLVQPAATVGMTAVGATSTTQAPPPADVRDAWPDHPDSTMWLAENGFQLAAREPGRFVAVAAPVAPLSQSALVHATFHKVGGPPGGGYGLIVNDQGPAPRDGVNQDGRYDVLEVGDKGDVGIWRRDGDHWVDLVPWMHSDAVRPGGASNVLEARAIGGRLTLRVNNVDVASAPENLLTYGGIGVFVGGDDNEVSLEQFGVDLMP
jgi:signal peptidase I